MALIIYDTDNWDSYISLTDAEDLVTSYIIDTSTWDALDDTVKEKYLRQATMLIKSRITLKEGDTTDNLKLATVYLAVFSIAKDMTQSDGKDNLKIIEIDGAIKKEFFTKGKSSNQFPDIVTQLLQEYNYTSSSTFKMERS